MEPTLPEGFVWCEYVRNEDPFWIGIRSSLVGFVAIGPRFMPSFVGTGFVIGVSEDGYLLVLTAKHVVVEGVVGIQQPHQRRARNAPAILFEPERPRIGGKELRACWMGADQADLMFVRHISYADTVDIALCVLEAQKGVASALQAKINVVSLDTRIPDVGSWINVVSLTGFAYDGHSPKGDGAGLWSVSNRPVVRVGRVLSQEVAAMGHRGPCFRTSIPVSAGMSGGFAYVPRDGLPVAACGIVTASSTMDHEQTSFLVTGNSLMVAIAGALALEMPPQSNCGPILFDALKDGQINDVAGGAKALVVEKAQDGGWRIRRAVSKRGAD